VIIWLARVKGENHKGNVGRNQLI